ncbi:hypothetical protein [Terrihabitans sp. B22-R8]
MTKPTRNSNPGRGMPEDLEIILLITALVGGTILEMLHLFAWPLR